ncbi:hypothetical protein [Crassaminicella indica]|uniref:Uncharacterized protein n=1 Tax=Crassaminicella indica TaxID=2855394 RepID=A0ABX8RCP4_9CLOT|nr:hypothetical protein [Crassaminicella indica]QXM06219.1 hypothetical protein KVH43_12870 [Crassaminicella indica]
MNLFKNKQVPSQEKARKNSLGQKFIILSILMIFITTSFVYLTQQDLIMKNSIVKSFFYIKQKKQIFTYLKSIQFIEEQFYTLVNETIDLKNQSIYQDNKELLQENIAAIDDMMIKLANVKTNYYMIENHYLFLEEMKTMRDVLLEKKLSVVYNDEKSLTRANEYLKKYFIVGQMRRSSLKKVFDKYDIIYLELDNRIKYITE